MTAERGIHDLSLGDVLPVSQIPETGLEVRLEADETARRAVASLLGVPEVAAFEGRCTLRREGDGVIVAGDVAADLVRTCVVSLEPMTEAIRARFRVLYTTAETVAALDAAPAPSDPDAAGGVAGSPGADMDYDLLPGIGLCPGDIMIEQTAREMAAHPRRNDAMPPKALAPARPGGAFAGLADMLAAGGGDPDEEPKQ